MTYPIEIAQKRITTKKYSGIIVSPGNILNIKDKPAGPSFLTVAATVWASMLAIAAITLFMVFLVVPSRELSRHEEGVLSVISGIETVLPRGSISFALNEIGIEDWHITNFADSVVILSITGDVDLFTISHALEGLVGVMGIQYTPESVNIKILRGAL
jgi:hypothetical protein